MYAGCICFKGEIQYNSPNWTVVTNGFGYMYKIKLLDKLCYFNIKFIIQSSYTTEKIFEGVNVLLKPLKKWQFILQIS